MKKIGIIKEIDSIGRIVIPKELRDRYSLYGNVEIVATQDGVLIKNIEYMLTRIERRERN